MLRAGPVTAIGALAATMLAGPVAAAMPEANAQGLLDAATVCTANNGGVIADSALTANGWKAGTVTREDGGEKTMRFYGRGTGDPMILIAPGEGGKESCVVMAAIADGDADRIRARFTETFGEGGKSGSGTLYRQGRDVILLNFSDAGDAPQAQIMIIELGD